MTCAGSGPEWFLSPSELRALALRVQVAELGSSGSGGAGTERLMDAATEQSTWISRATHFSAFFIYLRRHGLDLPPLRLWWSLSAICSNVGMLPLARVWDTSPCCIMYRR